MIQGNERILVVDDNAPMREVFSKALRRVGFHCEVAESADDADRVLQQGEFALTLLDVNMPGKSGFTLLPELNERHPDMAIVMVTGEDELSNAVLTMKDGASDYVIKPVPISLLIFRVFNALSRRALLLENRAYRKILEREGLIDEAPGGPRPD